MGLPHIPSTASMPERQAEADPEAAANEAKRQEMLPVMPLMNRKGRIRRRASTHAKWGVLLLEQRRKAVKLAAKVRTRKRCDMLFSVVTNLIRTQNSCSHISRITMIS